MSAASVRRIVHLISQGQGNGAAPLAPPLWRPVALLPLPPPQFNSSWLGFLVMQFKVGDVVHNKVTREEGRIVRIADLPDYGLCYIVSVALNQTWGATPREAIWKRSEVTD
jgi:hypothetical protein